MGDCSKMSQLTFESSIKKGKEAELLAKKDFEEEGFSITPTGKGHDFRAIKHLPDSGEYLEYYVEVKSGKAKLSKLQQRTKNKLKREGKNFFHYVVQDQSLVHFTTKNYLEKLENSLITKTRFNRNNFRGKFMIRDPTNCPNCKLVSRGIVSIYVDFGLRNMKDGIVREQSWCRKCREFLRLKTR